MFFQEPGRFERIHTTATVEDIAYCKQHGLKFAHLLRGAIRDHKVRTNDPDAEPSAKEIYNKMNKLKELNEKLLRVINTKFSEDEALEIFRNL